MSNKCLDVIIDPNTSIPHLFTEDPLSDPHACLGLTLNPDGSVTRQIEFPTRPASSDPRSNSEPVLTKDLTINETRKTYARFFLPRQVLESSTEVTKLPLLVDFHGGGFVSFNASSAWYHNFYKVIATETPAVIASIDYRRAPEHRLPAAYDDGMEALDWIKNADEDWLVKYTDLSNCFVMGNSAGGNIAYHVGLRACSRADYLRPLRIKGLILLQPFFGGVKRTLSELREKVVCSSGVTDICWELSLPVGADRDHEYSNPTKAVNAEALDQIKRLGWKILVKGSEGDPMIDRQIEFAKMLKGNGVQVLTSFEEGGYHGVDVMEPERAKAFSHLIKKVLTSG